MLARSNQSLRGSVFLPLVFWGHSEKIMPKYDVNEGKRRLREMQVITIYELPKNNPLERIMKLRKNGQENYWSIRIQTEWATCIFLAWIFLLKYRSLSPSSFFAQNLFKEGIHRPTRVIYNRVKKEHYEKIKLKKHIEQKQGAGNLEAGKQVEENVALEK